MEIKSVLKGAINQFLLFLIPIINLVVFSISQKSGLIFMFFAIIIILVIILKQKELHPATLIFYAISIGFLGDTFISSPYKASTLIWIGIGTAALVMYFENIFKISRDWINILRKPN